MRALFWLLGIVIVAMGLYCMPSPPVARGAAGSVRPAAVQNESRSMMVRLAKAGQAMRQREAQTAGRIHGTKAAISFVGR